MILFLRLGLTNAPLLFARESDPALEEMIKRKFSRTGDVQDVIRIVKESGGIEKVCYITNIGYSFLV